MDADEPEKKVSIQEPPPKEEAAKKKVNRTGQHPDTEPSNVPKNDTDGRKPDPEDTERKIETFGAVGAAAAAAAIFQNILPR